LIKEIAGRMLVAMLKLKGIDGRAHQAEKKAVFLCYHEELQQLWFYLTLE
jgi:hypothetical protein